MDNKSIENNIDNEFTDINKESKSKPYVVVIILYIIVIILTILLIFGLKHQKDTVDNAINETNKIPENNEIDDSNKNENNIIDDNNIQNIPEDIPNIDEVPGNSGNSNIPVNPEENIIDNNIDSGVNNNNNNNNSMLGDESSILDMLG